MNNAQAIEIIEQALDSEISLPECEGYLEEMEIRGSFNVDGYVGYDYINQEWIKVEA